MPERILITNATIVNENQVFEGDVRIEGGRIAAIGTSLSGQPGERTIDATGLHLLPGLIDDQVHFREPGLTHKGDIASESRAAVAGGVTSFMEMPNTKPPAVTHEQLEAKYQRAAAVSLANYSFYFGATNDNLESVRRADPATVCGIKVFMGSSTGNMLVDNRETLDRIFAEAPMLVATHCEDTPTIEANAEAFRQKYGEAVPISAHPKIRSAEACYTSSAMAVELARRHGARLHILHISTAAELALFSSAPLSEKHITAEACVHHLYFNSRDYDVLGTRIMCNPAIKSEADQLAVLQAVRDGRIDVIATDHAPHTLEEKARPYFQAPSGVPLVQHSLQILLEHYHNGLLPLELIVTKTSHAVADLFEIRERGYIREGYWADLVLVNLNRPQTVAKENILYKCGWSPFEGHTFPSSVVATVVSGRLVFREGNIIEGTPGKRLLFDRVPRNK